VAACMEVVGGPDPTDKLHHCILFRCWLSVLTACLRNRELRFGKVWLGRRTTYLLKA
jgi:hypothetical protein